MRIASPPARALVSLVFVAAASCGGGGAPPVECTLEEWAEAAISEDPAAVSAGITALRDAGPEGHRALLEAHPETLASLRAGARSEAGERLRHAIDMVSGQRDGHASGLYWYTDLDAARREAARTERPILSLRLLGRLDEEYSCANSRYFRLLLYSNPEVAARLAERYVLHWSTERPAPQITIDMGDGRVIRRTITGNSAHYVLDAEGRPVDVLVGLYAPRGFLAALDRAEAIHQRCDGEELSRCLPRAHQDDLDARVARWEAMRRIVPGADPFAFMGAPVPSFDDARASLPAPPMRNSPTARQAMPLTAEKFQAEMPMVDLIEPVREREAPAEEPDWMTIGRRQGLDARADESTLALLRLKMGRDDVAAVAVRLSALALVDGVRNELLFHHRISEWFADRLDGTDSFPALNERVYGELMQTPIHDPWLGLREPDFFDGIEIERPDALVE